MRKEIEYDLEMAQRRLDALNDNIPPILLADLEALVHLLLCIVIRILKRELKRLA